MKERKEMKAEEARMARTAARRAVPGKGGATASLSRDAQRTPGSRVGTTSGSSGTKKSATVVEEKRVKKAALATTGYTGTARPRTGATAPAKPGSTSRPSSVGPSRDKPRYGSQLSSSRRRYEDEEDDDLDDFIEYDEEDEAPAYGAGRRYKYDSYDDESDMEAGLSDIEDEETKAERYARREDLEQEALEKRLKQEKEERRRRFLEAAKAKASGR